MDEKIKKLKEWVAESDNIVFFGGAGVSTESGIPDFRSVDGLYNQQWKYPPETILSHSFFSKFPEEYYRFHRAKLVIEGVKPNRAHLRLAELEREAKAIGACMVMLDARDWNVAFFQKRGYTVYCTLEDYPDGRRKYKLQKRI